jgi:hypothetical protein
MNQIDSKTKRARLDTLIIFDAICFVLAFLAFTVPIQDYALREYRVWLREHSPESWNAFQNKKKEEAEIRTVIGSIFAVTGVGLGLFILRKRSGSSWS